MCDLRGLQLTSTWVDLIFVRLLDVRGDGRPGV